MMPVRTTHATQRSQSLGWRGKGETDSEQTDFRPPYQYLNSGDERKPATTSQSVSTDTLSCHCDEKSKENRSMLMAPQCHYSLRLFLQ